MWKGVVDQLQLIEPYCWYSKGIDSSMHEFV